MTTRNMSGIKRGYLLDNDWVNARRRLAILEASADPVTIRHLEGLRVDDGWHCLEIGGGGGSITEWLCRRVGQTGRVVATDLNPRFLNALDYPNLEVRQHNIVEDELESEAFDFVHTRAVLTFIGERSTALDRIVSALKPGGWALL